MVEQVYGRLEPAMLADLIAESIGVTSAQSQQTGAKKAPPDRFNGPEAGANPAELAPHRTPISNPLLGAVREIKDLANCSHWIDRCPVAITNGFRS